MFRKPMVVLLVVSALSVALSAVVFAQTDDPSTRQAPIRSYSFRVEIEGVTQGKFTEVTGLDIETQVMEYQDGDDLLLRKRPGRTKYSNITLVSSPRNPVLADLWRWYQDTISHEAATTDIKRDIVISVVNQEGRGILRFNLTDSFPIAWKFSSLDGKGNDVLTEEITFAVERIERQ